MLPSKGKPAGAGALTPARWGIAVSDGLAALGLFAMMAVAFIDVVGRSFFSAPMPGATELTELLVAATVCCVMPSLAWRGMHATIDVLDAFVPARLRPFQLAAADLISAVCFSFVAWRVWIEGDKTARFGGKTPLLEVPMAPVLYVSAIFFALAGLAFVLAIFRPNDPDDL